MKGQSKSKNRARKTTRRRSGSNWRHTIMKVYDADVSGPAIMDPDAVAELIKSVLDAEGDTRDQEHVWVLGLDTKNRLRILQLAGLGGFSSAPVDPRVVFRALIANACSGLILAHNHPSGDPSPSREDYELCERINQGARILGYRLLDFVIVGNTGRRCSFSERGIL